MDLGAVRGELAAALEGLGLHVYPDEETAAELPAAVIRWPTFIDYTNVTYGDTERCLLEFPVLVAVGAGNGINAAVTQLDTYLSTGAPSSVPDALKATTKVRVMRADNFRQVDFSGVSALGVDLTVHCIR